MNLKPTNILTRVLILSLISIASNLVMGQSCEDIMDFVRSEDRGITYRSYDSEAISWVTFYEVSIEYQRYYFAIVCFKSNYYGCSEYIYQVASNTKMYYAMNYLDSAGKAFWNYIQPFNKNLGCAPNM